MKDKEQGNEVLRCQEHIVELRQNDTMLPSELALACGILLGAGYPGCAAAVANAYERLYPELKQELSLLP